MILLNRFNIPAVNAINVWPVRVELDEISVFSAAAAAAAAGRAKVGLSETPKCQRG